MLLNVQFCLEVATLQRRLHLPCASAGGVSTGQFSLQVGSLSTIVA